MTCLKLSIDLIEVELMTYCELLTYLNVIIDLFVNNYDLIYVNC